MLSGSHAMQCKALWLGVCKYETENFKTWDISETQDFHDTYHILLNMARSYWEKYIKNLIKI